MCYPVCGMVHIKEPLLLIGKSSPCSGSSGVFSRYLNGPLPYVRRQISVYNMIMMIIIILMIIMIITIIMIIIIVIIIIIIITIIIITIIIIIIINLKYLSHQYNCC